MKSLILLLIAMSAAGTFPFIREYETFSVK